MTDKKSNPLSSRSLLERIGIHDDGMGNLLLEDDTLDSPLAALAQALQARYASLNTRHVFKPGDLVFWKDGLRNRRYPRNGKPAIVLEVLQQPVIDEEEDSGSTYFREPLDIVLGCFVDEGEHRGDFFSGHFDSRRLELWQQGEQQ